MPPTSSSALSSGFLRLGKAWQVTATQCSRGLYLTWWTTSLSPAAQSTSGTPPGSLGFRLFCAHFLFYGVVSAPRRILPYTSEHIGNVVQADQVVRTRGRFEMFPTADKLVAVDLYIGCISIRTDKDHGPAPSTGNGATATSQQQGAASRNHSDHGNSNARRKAISVEEVSCYCPAEGSMGTVPFSPIFFHLLHPHFLFYGVVSLPRCMAGCIPQQIS